MPHNEDSYLSLDSSVFKRWSTARIFNVSVALIGGAFLGLLATSVFAPKLKSASVATPTSLLATMSAMSRPSSLKTIAPGYGSPTLASLPGPSVWKELAISAIEANNRCEIGGPKPTPRFAAALANVKSKDMVVARAGVSNAKDMVGAMPPLGFWDPLGFSTKASPGRLAYYREAELKHGRVCMLASLGFIVSEKYHPFFGGNIDGGALQQFQAVELTRFWPAVLAFSGGVELVKGAKRFEVKKGEGRVLKEGLIPGDIGYDPLGIKNTWKEGDKFEEKELANGRLAMIALLGMVGQELAFPQIKLGLR